MSLHFTHPDGSATDIEVSHLLNAGYAGRHQDHIAAHIAELVAAGVPAPTTTPTMYPIAPYLAQQTSLVQVQHAKTYGEVEWALIVDDNHRLLVTLASDHTDHDLEVHGIGWSKNACPNVLASEAWPLDDVLTNIDRLTLDAWVSRAGVEWKVQTGTFADLLPPAYWLGVLNERGLLQPGTVLLSGTINMLEDADKFGDSWRGELTDPLLGRTISLRYDIVTMTEPIG